MTDDDQVARWKRITEAASPAPWLHSLDKFDDEEYCALVCSDGPGYALFAKLGIEGVKPHCHTGERWTAEDSAKRSAQEHLARSSQEMRDALFIEIARTAMPMLLAEVERLRGEVACLRKLYDAAVLWEGAARLPDCESDNLEEVIGATREALRGLP